MLKSVKMSEMDKKLFEAAKKARENAHVPYSNFAVGAAILAENGKIYVGCNVENAAYPEGNCAETIAIGAMVLDRQLKIKKIYIVGNGKNPVVPCGGCRQRISEFGVADTIVISHGIDGEPMKQNFAELLPYSFSSSHLEAKE